MKIRVTKSHIKRGKRESAHLCPVALAITAVTNHETSVLPDYIVDEVDGQEYWCPDSVQRFMELFDSEEREHRKQCKPFEFQLKKKPA